MPKPVIKVDLYSHMAKQKDGFDKKGYKGLDVYALPGLHEYIGNLVRKIFTSKARLFDIAAGAGALTLRLLDMGYDMTACDLVEENFRLTGKVNFFKVDLNSEFSKKINEVFDGVIAAEIIEHLENPRHLLREIMSLLTPGGTLILTTPNVDNPVSIAFFARLGMFQWFNDTNYEHDGHITPITQWSMHKYLREAGYEGIEIHSFGDPFKAMHNWPKMKLFAKFLALVSHADGRANGEILVVTARKPR